jgi:four helix bundle protein
MKSYRELEIFQESKRLAIEVHLLSLGLPKFELYEEGSQIRRSSKAVCAMIVEGYGRKRYKADFIKHLVYAHTECDETILHLDFLLETGSLADKKRGHDLREEYSSLSKKINKYTRWVEENFESHPQEKRPKDLAQLPVVSNLQAETDDDDLKKHLL